MATWKDICQEDLLAPSTHLPRTALSVKRRRTGEKRERVKSVLRTGGETCTPLNIIFHPSRTPTDLDTAGLYQFSALFFSCARKHNCEGTAWEMSYTFHFSLPLNFILRGNILQPGRILYLQITSQNTATSEGENEIVSVWCSPRITERHIRWLEACWLRMNGRDRVPCTQQRPYLAQFWGIMSRVKHPLPLLIDV